MAKINFGIAGVEATPPIAPPSFEPSDEQRAIFEFAERAPGNLRVDARAGTGKTTSMVEVSKRRRGAFLAFNKGIATEVGHKLALAGISDKDMKAATFHSVGFQAWMKHAPKARNVRPEKLDILAEKIRVPNRLKAFVVKLADYGKQALVGAVADLPADDTESWLGIVEHHDLLDLMPQGDEDLDEEQFLEEGLAWTHKLLRQSILESETMIDFTDMLYMPLYAQLRFWQYETVIIDEAQDTNRARREIAKRLLQQRGMLICVGDPHQAIYGFTGADSDAMDRLSDAFQCETLPLTITRRCPKRVVRLAQTWVPDIRAADDAPEGEYGVLDEAAFAKIVPQDTDAILCRNMRPLARLAFSYLRRHIPCVIEGRELGGSLITLARRWRSASTLGELSSHLDEHLERETEKFLLKHQLAKAGLVRDKVETLKALMEGLSAEDHPEKLVDLINRLFKDSDGLAKRVTVLSTIHKAKGREWDRVFLLGRNTLMPSPYARQEWQLQQEANLAYVAVTRAKHSLIEVNLVGR